MVACAPGLLPVLHDEGILSARYLHWEPVDPGFDSGLRLRVIHWSVANLPIGCADVRLYDSHALAIPPDLSRQLPP